jgi:cytochrome c biogenesis factor
MEDLYVSIHNIDSASVGLLVLINPMVSWIWIATAIMALGGLVALVPSLRGAAATAPGPAPAAPIAIEGSP